MALPRFCANPDCTKKHPFVPISDAALCCCIKCKNRKNYIENSLEYIWEILRIGERKRNRKILEYLFSIGQFKVMREALMQMGFTFEVVFLPVVDDNGISHFRFGNCYLKCIDENFFEIIYIND